MYPACGGLWNAVAGVRLFPSHPNLDHIGFILHQLTDGFPPESAQSREFRDPVVFLERIGVRLLRHLPTVRLACLHCYHTCKIGN